MTGTPRFTRSRKLLAGLAIVILLALWYAFRPEKLFVNQKVSEAAPAGVAAEQPSFTASLHALPSAARTSGRVNVVISADRRQLEIVNFKSDAAGPFTVLLDRTQDSANPLGTVGGNVPSARLDLPQSIDLSLDKLIVVKDGAGRGVATAELEPF